MHFVKVLSLLLIALNLKKCSIIREISLNGREDLKFILQNIENTVKQNSSTQMPSKSSIKHYKEKFKEKNITNLVKFYVEVFKYETNSYESERINLKIVDLITIDKLLKLHVANESLQMQKRYLFNVRKFLNPYISKAASRFEFFFLFVNGTWKTKAENLLDSVLKEWLCRENILKIQTCPNESNELSNISYKNHLLNIETPYKRSLNTKIVTYYQRFRMTLKRNDPSNNTIYFSLLFFLLNANIFESKDFKYLSLFCKEFNRLKNFNESFWESSISMRSIHHLLTQSIFDMRCIIILLFGDMKSLFQFQYIPIYKLEILSNFKTRLLTSFYFYNKNETMKSARFIQYYNLVENILQLKFNEVNNLQSSYNLLEFIQNYISQNP
ncbi:hypothetical protein TUBRATIS_24480 [Tubulinosema ratisbonensis]|uniref:Uncharacterized protein n=1 Tax=Tubulinosema ratisbonensis TaxID=291195 RepID=A0A437AIW6_9MICR|nr:hypothetical protein TUBRATIS_24480 [Tubulinosema ratisbonensis]